MTEGRGYEKENITCTLNHLLKSPPSDKELLLICGSFFIMTDVRQYFEYENEEIDQFII